MTDEFNPDDMDDLSNSMDDMSESASDKMSDMADNASDKLGDAFESIKNTVDDALTPSETVENVNKSDINSDDKLWALLSWLFWPIALIVFFINDRPYARYHAVTSLAVGLVFSAISALTGGFGCLLFFISLYYAFKAFGGNWIEVPLVSGFLKGQGWV